MATLLKSVPISRHVPRSQKDPRSWIPRIQDPGSCRILDLIFSFSHGILEILDHVTTTFPWDPRDLGSRTEKILLNPGDPGSSLSNLSWDLADLGSYTTIMPLYFEHPLHQVKFCFWFPISFRFLKLGTLNNFNHTLVQPFCVGLKQSHFVGSLTCFFIIDVLLTGCREMNVYFITL